MKFLYLKTKDSAIDIAWSLIELGHQIDCLEEYVFDPNTINIEANHALSEILVKKKYDFVINYMFNPEISNICNANNIKYISWTYDSPLPSLFSNSINNPCNITFIFDKSEYARLKNMNVNNVFYMPLAVNMSRISALLITDADVKNYTSEISFIGSLYEDNFYNEIVSYLPEGYKKELCDYILANTCRWEKKKEWPAVSSDLSDFITSSLPNLTFNAFNLSKEQYFGLLILSRKLCEMDRISVLNLLARNYSVDLYTKSKTNHLQNIKAHTSVDYMTIMNKIFYCSKINLNITLPSIETGIPQRIFDIMGCGGFVLTNYQEEIPTLFEIGKEIEVFHNQEELQEKVDFYLNHDTIRKKIGLNGYMKVRDNYTYIHQVSKILNIAQEYL